MIFERKAYQMLKEWKQTTSGKRALLIEGARRVGKSTLAEEFAKREYKSYLLIDFAHASKKVLSYFEDYKDSFDELFLLLSTEYGVPLYKRESLIIFDEIQRFPTAREMIKYLVADGRYDYIETGSLISIKENTKGIVIPSEERKLKMYPLDFEEFCWAHEERELVEYLRHCFEVKKPIDNNIHKKAMFLFREYMLIGGMPQAVAAYLEGSLDYIGADLEKRDILNLYREDIMKIKAPYATKVLSIYERIPEFLSKHEKRVRLNQIAEGSTIDQYSETFFWLGNSMICNECFLSTDPNIGLAINEDRTSIKCYMGDTGLLISHSFTGQEMADENLYNHFLTGSLSINEGMFFENVVAQMLTARGHDLYFYTSYNEEKHRNDIEIDFILSNKSKLKFKIFPMEVKSSNRYSTVSLNRFNEKYKSRVGGAYVIHPGGYREENGITYLPVYMTTFL